MRGLSVAGIDFQYRNSNFLGGNILQSDVFYEHSFSDLKGDDDAFGIALNYPNEPWGWELAFKEVGINYDPALGFTNRPGIRIYDADIRHMTRYGGGDSFLRQLQFSASRIILISPEWMACRS